jgi:hypothetical protein
MVETLATQILQLTLRREFFSAIYAKKKHREYREAKPYWRTRLEGRKYEIIHFRNGYYTNAPTMDVEFRGVSLVGKGRNAKYVIRLGRIVKTKDWPPRKKKSSR